MGSGFRVAVAGATGAVGREMIETLERRGFPVSSLRLLASERSEGKTLSFRGEPVRVEVLRPDAFKGIEIALFSAGAQRSREFAPAAVKAGAVVIDNSSAFRYEDHVPLVVPEVNAPAVSKHTGIIANPNCSTIIMVVAIHPVHELSPLESVIVSTYQAVSGAGASGMVALEEEIRTGERDSSGVFPHQIAYNLVPRIDALQPNGYTKEEMKMTWETRKIMDLPDLPVSATCVRVPVRRAHSEAVHMTTRESLTVEQVREALAKTPGVQVLDRPEDDVYPTPLRVTGEYDVFVGRIRRDPSFPRSIDMWVVGDQLLKGAALNAVQIAEILTGSSGSRPSGDRPSGVSAMPCGT